MTIQSVNHSIEQLKAYEMDKSNEELTREYGFSDENLEKFAELLFDFAAASPDRDATVRLACGITAIYRYLDEKKAPVSLNRYYILKELENMTAR